MIFWNNEVAGWDAFRASYRMQLGEPYPDSAWPRGKNGEFHKHGRRAGRPVNGARRGWNDRLRQLYIGSTGVLKRGSNA